MTRVSEKSLLTAFESLVHDYQVVKKDVPDDSSLQQITYFVDSSEAYRYVYFDEDAPARFSYRSRDDLSARAAKEAILRTLLFNSSIDTYFLPGHWEEYLNLETSSRSKNMEYLSRLIQIAHDKLHANSSIIQTICNLLEMHGKSGDRYYENEALSLLYEYAPALLMCSLVSEKTFSDRISSLSRSIKVSLYPGDYSEAMDHDYFEIIKSRALALFREYRSGNSFFSSDLIDARCLAITACLNMTNRRRKFRIVSAAKSFWHVVNRLDYQKDLAICGLTFANLVRHPRIFSIYGYLDHNKKTWLAYLKRSERDFSSGAEHFEQLQTVNDKAFRNFLDVERTEFWQDRLSEFEDGVLANALGESRKPVGIAIDFKKIYQLLSSDDSLREEIVRRAFEAIADISAMYADRSLSLLAERTARNDGKIYGPLAFHGKTQLSKTVHSKRTDVISTDFLTVGGMIVPFSVRLLNTELMSVLTESIAIAEIPLRLESHFVRNHISQLEERAVLAYVFAAIEEWSLALEFCNSALLESVVGQKPLAAEIYAFRCTSRRYAVVDCGIEKNTLAIRRCFDDLISAIDLFPSSEIPARYLIEIALVISRLETLDCDGNISSHFATNFGRIPFDTEEILTAVVNRGGLSTSESLTVYNSLAYSAVLRRDFESARKYVSSLELTLEVGGFSFAHLPLNIFHTVLMAALGSRKSLSGDEKMEFRNIYRSESYRPWYAMRSDREKVLEEIEEILKD